MKAVLILWLACTSASWSADIPATVHISEALHTETIPRLELNSATSEEALALVRQQWEKQHPKEPFPVGITDYEAGNGYVPRITLDLKNIPYVDALRIVCAQSGRRLIERVGTFQLQQIVLMDEDWQTQSYPVTPEILTALGLRATSSSDDVRVAFTKLGVELKDWMKPIICNDRIVVTSYEPQLHQMEGILFLLSRGFKISRPEA